MKRFAMILLVAAAFWSRPASSDPAEKTDACAAFRQKVAATYNFDEARLSDEEKLVLETKLDAFWTDFKAHQKEHLPCLREVLQDPKTNAFFRFDGSNLLVEFDPSLASKSLQTQIYTNADWDMVGAERWMSVMLERAWEDIDVTAAAERWLSDPEIGYILPEHGDFEVDSFMGAAVLYGSMDETQATPSLLKIVNNKRHPQREAALEILTAQATPEAWHALQKLDMTNIDEDARTNVEGLLAQPELIEPRAKPLVAREEFLRAFKAITEGSSKPFFDLVDKVEDGERDAVVVLRPEDLPLVRRARRRFMMGGNQHALEYSQDFTDILWTLVWKWEPAPLKVASAKQF